MIAHRTDEKADKTLTYTYPDSGHDSVRPHAVIAVNDSDVANTYTYDASGNMTVCVENGTTYTQT
jgi:hypothetical protein